MAGLLEYPKPQTANPLADALTAMGANLAPQAPDKTTPFPSPVGEIKEIAPDKINPFPLPVGAATKPLPVPDKVSPFPAPNPTPAPAPAPVPAPTPPAPDNRTVEQRLNGLIAADSDYIRMAEAGGIATANKRGLANSSIAAGAARGAAIDRALPIATADAQIAASQQLQKQQGEIQSRLQGEQFGYQGQLNTQQNAAQMEQIRTQLASSDNQQQRDIAAQMDRLNTSAGQEMARLQAQLANANDQQKLEITAQMDRLRVSTDSEMQRLVAAAGFDMSRLQVDAANNLIRDAAQATSQQELVRVQGTIQAALQAQGNSEQIQRMGVDLQNQLQLQDRQLSGDLSKITASGNEDIRRLVEAGNQERVTLQQSIAGQDRQAMASSMVNIFQVEQQLRAALLSNDKISATERAAYEQTITALGQPIRDFMNKLFGPQGASGTSFPSSVSGLPQISGGDAGGSGGVGDNLGTTGIVGLPGGGGLGGGGGDLGTFGQDSAWLPFTPEANNAGVPSIDNPLPGLGGYGNNGMTGNGAAYQPFQPGPDPLTVGGTDNGLMPGLPDETKRLLGIMD